MAVDRTSPNGRVVGIDIIPAQPPKGVSTLQGNFLSPAVQQEVKRFLRDSKPGRAKEERSLGGSEHDEMTADDRAEQSLSYLEREKMAEDADDDITTTGDGITAKAEAETEKRTVDVVLSDMSAPWAQTDGFWKRSLSNPYYRMMNTSGNGFRDHAGSMVNPPSTQQLLHRSKPTQTKMGHLICFLTGSLQRSPPLRLRHAPPRGPFRV